MCFDEIIGKEISYSCPFVQFKHFLWLFYDYSELMFFIQTMPSNSKDFTLAQSCAFTWLLWTITRYRFLTFTKCVFTECLLQKRCFLFWWRQILFKFLIFAFSTIRLSANRLWTSTSSKKVFYSLPQSIFKALNTNNV